jgi:flagellar protein FliS
MPRVDKNIERFDTNQDDIPTLGADTMFLAQRALHNYNTIDTDAKASFATPYQLTQMLFAGAMKSLALVPVLMERKEFATCAKEVTRSVGIINGLRESLDLSQGELAENLYELYSYMTREIIRAHREKDPEAVRKVRALLAEIDEAWNQIPIELRG